VFAHASGPELSVVVCDDKGKEKEAVVVQLIIDKPKKDVAVIIGARVELAKK
jgi:hypothetical protein